MYIVFLPMTTRYLHDFHRNLLLVTYLMVSSMEFLPSAEEEFNYLHQQPIMA